MTAIETTTPTTATETPSAAPASTPSSPEPKKAPPKKAAPVTKTAAPVVQAKERKPREIKFKRHHMVVWTEGSKERQGIVINDEDATKLLILTSTGTVTKSHTQLRKLAGGNPTKWVENMSKVSESVIGKELHTLIATVAADEKKSDFDKAVKIGTAMWGKNYARQYTPKDKPVLK